ncbi:exo-alpha-sialidase [Ramlibacter alkalitolerans]|uniref:Exo-alpha-sialidase n=1 Tax=Ramlibacter alkalitolerans TaxID=2039631 RepID=A0ABS1JNX6_9BURK|nr:exo-alpha-sialidase [Ramlibacter alkalitolerans]MBL0425962.1 exo-alpha-sialidase [Ramlibacter alkalitolerans]
MLTTRRKLTALFLAATIAGCGGGSESSSPAGTTSTAAPAALSVPPQTVAPAALSVPPQSIPPAVVSVPQQTVSTVPAETDPSPPPDGSHVLLDLPLSGKDPARIDYQALPALGGTHALVSPIDSARTFQLHSYLTHHDGMFWAMWSHGVPGDTPGPLEDEPGQEVLYSTSKDGVNWGPARTLSGAPRDGYAFIARGFWIRNGELLALAANFKGKGAFGVNKDLQLQAFAWDRDTREWRLRETLYRDAINNFSPERLASGEWLMSRRDTRYNVYMLAGGDASIGDWLSIPVVKRLEVPGFVPDEPIWWEQGDSSLVSLFRDNAESKRIFFSTSNDSARTWTMPVKTNFPNATSKLFALKTGTGCRVLILNANPGVGRRDLHLATSQDGLVFRQLYSLSIPSPISTLQYPHAIEYDNALYITFSRGKSSIELLRVPLTGELAQCR